MKRIAVFGNRHQDEKLPAVARFVNALAAAGLDVVFEPGFRDYLYRAGLIEADARGVTAGDAAAIDMAIAFGGDGTFLHAASAIAPLAVPILGVNTGHLGYLASAGVDEAPAVVSAIAESRYIVEPRTMLSVAADGVNLDVPPYALNEIAILKRDSASMIAVNPSVDGEPLARCQADGLIIATPTGSTAYNLSVGGPIIDPQAGVWVISPVAPHTLTMRPIVVKDSSVLTAVPSGRTSSFRLSVDGRSVSVPMDTELTIGRAPFDTLLVRMPGSDYLSTLRTKLLWGK